MTELSTKTDYAHNADADNAYNADELGQYQAVSLSAVFALLLGLSSPLAFFSPVLLLIPVLATAASLVALLKLRVAGSGLTGARLARVGLALAIFFGVACCARIAVINILVSQDHAAKPSVDAPSSTATSSSATAPSTTMLWELAAKSVTD